MSEHFFEAENIPAGGLKSKALSMCSEAAF